MAGRAITVACLQGYNGTIFAYGQTGSGKTFTILGAAGCKGRKGAVVCSLSSRRPQRGCGQRGGRIHAGNAP